MCFVCDRIKETRVGNNPFFVKELETGYVVKVPLFINQDEEIIIATVPESCSVIVPVTAIIQKSFKK